MLRSCLATFYYKALRRSHMAAGAWHCSNGQGSKGQGKALLQGFNNARARALARALDKPGTALGQTWDCASESGGDASHDIRQLR